MSIHHLTSPFQDYQLSSVKAGDTIFVSGVIYAARDAAHKRMADCLRTNTTLPLNILGQTIYYMGPTPTRPGNSIGSCGPTTSSRMDKYTPLLLKQGLKAIIGKGQLSAEVDRSLMENRAVYLVALGGCGALVAQTVKSCKTVAYEDLGAEAVLCLEVKDMQTVVALDLMGTSIF